MNFSCSSAEQALPARRTHHEGVLRMRVALAIQHIHVEKKVGLTRQAEFTALLAGAVVDLAVAESGAEGVDVVSKASEVVLRICHLAAADNEDCRSSASGLDVLEAPIDVEKGLVVIDEEASLE